ncbi:hypothetical protein JEP40_01840 [Proteus vulgaris]|uniref:hypothetical protein n=1 Tax=Proteus vulgaris TaxID=585 RepID=UPI0018E4621D|nr:hypothetical protein [Proteus vulgaris]MBI6527869.1 hypothetical protein [Proteus vulgaris]
MRNILFGNKYGVSRAIDQKKSVKIDEISNYQSLLKNINEAKNTFASLRYKEKSTDINLKDVSQRLAIMMLESTVKDLNSPTAKKLTLEQMIGKWKEEERVTLISAIINREIDHICAKKNKHLTGENRKEIFVELSKEYNIEINSKCAQSSIIQSLLRDTHVMEKISSLKIDEILKNNLTIKPLKNELVKIKNNTQENNNSITTILNENNMMINMEYSKIKGDLYNDLAKNVYNTLFYSDKSKPIPFDEIIQKVNYLTSTIMTKS